MSGKKRKNKKKKNKRFDLNVCNLDYKRLSESIAKADKIAKENLREEKKNIDYEIKNNSNNRLQNMFKMLWFFGIIFCLGAWLILNGTNNNFITELFSVYFMGSGLFVITSICFYIILELIMLSNKVGQNDKVIFESTEISYFLVIKKIILVFIFLIILLLMCGIFSSKLISLTFSDLFSPDNILKVIQNICVVICGFIIILLPRIVYRFVKNKTISELEKNLINKILDFFDFVLDYILGYASFILVAIYIVQNIGKG